MKIQLNECSIWCKFHMSGKMHIDECPNKITTHEEMIAQFEKERPGFKEGYEKELKRLKKNRH